MEDKRQMLAVTGVSVEEFAVLLKYFSEALEDWSNERSLMPKKLRQRKPGGGRKSKFKSDRDRLFFLLFYLKSYPIFEILAATFDISTSGAQEKVYRFAQRSSFPLSKSWARSLFGKPTPLSPCARLSPRRGHS